MGSRTPLPDPRCRYLAACLLACGDPSDAELPFRFETLATLLPLRGLTREVGLFAKPSNSLGCKRYDSDDELTVGICNDTASKSPTEFWTQVNDPLNRTTTKRASVAPEGLAVSPSCHPRRR